MEYLRLMIDTALVVLIWLVQLIIYPSFRCIEKGKFQEWHHTYTRSISILVFPLMLFQLATYLWALLVEHSWYFLGSMVLLAGLWIHTFFLSAPIHFKLGVTAYDLTKVNRLIRLNWWRVAGWNLVWVMSLYKIYC